MMSGITHPPGEIVATPMALAALGDETVERLLARHLRGDWGECGQIQDVRLSEKVYRLGHLATSDDATLNALAIEQNDGRVLSRYRIRWARLLRHHRWAGQYGGLYGGAEDG